ncbi:MFS transporter [Novosphingobium sp.]|uniref:MFS transporter n=1 Tax=Novosphingobium sp. TaxID=1874826 RepID=UPI0035B45A68
MKQRGKGYELALLVVLTLANGVVAFDRLAATFLSPYIVADLKLDNAQLGLLAGALSGAVAITAFLGGQLADRTGKRKLLLVACTLVFSLGSAAGGFAIGFASLFAARFLLGLAEGPMVPVSQTVMMDTSTPERRGFNMGVMQMAGAFLLGAMAGPIVATQVADSLGWRAAFFISAVPGVILALIMMALVKPDRPVDHAAGEAPPSLLGALGQLLAIRNMRVALGVAALFTAWLVLQNVFLPLHLTNDLALPGPTMGKVLSMGGIAGVIGGALLPLLSDRIGRKPVVIGACLAGLLAPAAMLTLPPDSFLLGAAILLGWLPLGIAPLYCATIPTESVPPALATSAVGLAMGTAELLGGVVAPGIAGYAADAYGRGAVFVICGGLALAAAAAALMLKETAPRALAKERT